jgi:hypothetical protein
MVYYSKKIPLYPAFTKGDFKFPSLKRGPAPLIRKAFLTGVREDYLINIYFFEGRVNIIPRPNG